MIDRRMLVAGVAFLLAAGPARARCGSGRAQRVVLTGRIAALDTESLELELKRGVRTILFGRRFSVEGYNAGDIVSVTCSVTTDGDFVAERIQRSGAREDSVPGGQQAPSHQH